MIIKFILRRRRISSGLKTGFCRNHRNPSRSTTEGMYVFGVLPFGFDKSLCYTCLLEYLMNFVVSHLSIIHHTIINQPDQIQVSNSSFTKLTHNFYFCRHPRLWNLLPIIDIDLHVSTLKSKLQKFLWTHFTSKFGDGNTCTFHYYCPCIRCSHLPCQPARKVY